MSNITNEDRNKAIAEALESLDGYVDRDVFGFLRENQLNWAQAIRDANNKARAWDELTDWFKTPGPATAVDVWAKMMELIAPPKPKSKLERLREDIEKGRILHSYFGSCVMVDSAALIDKIDRLEKEE